MQDKSQTSLASLTFSIPHAITRVFREQNRLHGRAVQPFGLSTEQAHLLVVLWAYGPISMGDLGREVALSSGTLSTAVDRMEAAGLVRRVADEKDRRSVRVEAIPWPDARRAKLVQALVGTASEMLAPLTAKEQTTLHTLLERVLGSFDSASRKRPTRRR